MTQIERIIQGLMIIQQCFPDVSIDVVDSFILTVDYGIAQESSMAVWEGRLNWLGWGQYLGRWAFNTAG